MCPGRLISDPPVFDPDDGRSHRHGHVRSRVHTESEDSDENRPTFNANGGRVEEQNDRAVRTPPPTPSNPRIRYANVVTRETVDGRRPFLNTSINSVTISPIVGIGDTPEQLRAHGGLSARAFIRVQIQPLLELLREHVRHIREAYGPFGDSSQELRIVVSILGYLQIAITLADQLP
ncbi:hypothetical protein F4777DRAFT_2991 [Nemania sp. FL0916]|nr:hypothetical protein F4777DRAFT_2991 [Nemania sp. FL0916]